MKKYLLAILVLLLNVAVLTFIFYNTNVDVEILNPFSKEIIKTSFTNIAIGLYVIGLITAACCNSAADESNGEKLAQYKREYEKSEIEGEANSSKIKALENKIATLEAALKKSLE